MSAKNFPYELPNLYDAIAHGVDRYRANYDSVFENIPAVEVETLMKEAGLLSNWATTKAN